MEHDDVAEAAVIAVPDDVWGERPLAVVVRANGSDVAGEALLDLLRARFAKWQVPDRVLFAESIPKTATGKFSKKQLRDTMGSSTGSTTQRDV
jgi:fatty-acyl-CoA synthase